MTPLLDLELVEELARVNVAPGEPFLPAFLRGFRRDTDSALEQMLAQASRGDLAGVAEHAHRLKGSSASIGAPRLAEAFAGLQRAVVAPAPDDPPLAVRVEAMRRLLERSCQAIERYCLVRALRRGDPSNRGGNGTP